MDERLEKGECPKCWGKLEKCERHEDILMFCPACDALPNMPKKGKTTGKPVCPVCWSKSSQFGVSASPCSKCKSNRMYCSSHACQWCKCQGLTCPLCKLLIDTIHAEKKKPTCSKHDVPLVTIGLDDPKEFWCKECRDEKENSGKYQHHCGTMLAYCASHKCYVCPQCDVLSECVENCKVGQLIDYKGGANGNGTAVQWEWQEFLDYKDERPNIYKHLLALAKGWPSLKQVIEQYCKIYDSMQPEAVENLFADVSYFEDAVAGLKMAFVNLNLEEHTETDIEFNDDDVDHDRDEEMVEEENEDDNDGYGYCMGRRYKRKGSEDDGWGIPEAPRRKGNRKDYEDAKYYVTRPYHTNVTITEVKGELSDGAKVFSFKELITQEELMEAGFA